MSTLTDLDWTHYLTVDELHNALANLPDNEEVTVRFEADECGGIYSAGPALSCDDKPFFAIDCSDESLT